MLFIEATQVLVAKAVVILIVSLALKLREYGRAVVMIAQVIVYPDDVGVCLCPKTQTLTCVCSEFFSYRAAASERLPALVVDEVFPAENR